MKKIFFILIMISVSVSIFGQRRSILGNATLTGDTTLNIILADEIYKVDIFVTESSTDSCVVSFDPTYTIGGIEVTMDSTVIYPGVGYSIWDENYPLKNATIHNRDGAVTWITLLKYGGRQR